MPAITQSDGDGNSKRLPPPPPKKAPPAPPLRGFFDTPPAKPTTKSQASEKAEAIETARTALLLSQFDELNSWWQKAEKAMAAFRVPHEVQVTFNTRDYGEVDDPRGYESDCIGWWKRDNEWRICWGLFVEPYNDNMYWQLKPISECPMEQRVQAVEYLPKLIEAVRKARNDYIPKVSEAVDKLREAVKSMNLE